LSEGGWKRPAPSAFGHHFRNSFRAGRTGVPAEFKKIIVFYEIAAHRDWQGSWQGDCT
jgi:hypothetical protein